VKVELGNVAPRQVEQGLYHSHLIGGVEEHYHSYGDEAGNGRRLPRAGDLTVARDLHPLLSHTTTVDIDDSKTATEALADILSLWPHHSGEGASFVVCDNEELRGALLAAFNLPVIDGPTALYTNAGRDWVSQQVLGAAVAAATNQMKWIALTANSTAPAVTDTTLTGEITTAGGALVRAAGTVAHTTGASSSTVSNTFTANGSDALPVTLAKAGLLNAPTSGALGFATLLTATATLASSGDSLAVTWTVNH
jgi:hypothetical protein